LLLLLLLLPLLLLLLKDTTTLLSDSCALGGEDDMYDANSSGEGWALPRLVVGRSGNRIGSEPAFSGVAVLLTGGGEATTDLTESELFKGAASCALSGVAELTLLGASSRIK